MQSTRSRMTVFFGVALCIMMLSSQAFAQAEIYDCNIGPLFNSLALIKDTFARDIFKALGPSVKSFMGPALTLFLSIVAVTVLLTNNTGLIKKLGPTLVTVGISSILLTNGINAADPYVLQVSDAIEDSSLRAGSVIVSNTSGLIQLTPASYTYIQGGHSVVNGYAELACQIERQAIGIAQIMVDIAIGDGSFGVATVFRAFMCLIAMLPFLFVVGIFGAFMLEAMFKYVAIAILAPLLIGFLWLKPIRTVGGAALRVIAGAWLTIVLASGAMGFTLQGIDGFKTKMDNLMVALTSVSNVKAKKKFAYYCDGQTVYQDPESEWDIANGGGWTAIDPSDPDLQPPMTTDECAHSIAILNNGAWVVLQPVFLIMPIIGFISILLHMQSKSLASNLSGANDGAGPAAAVVMGAKMLGGAAVAGGMSILGGGNRAAFGQGGLQSSVSDIMNGRSNVTAGAGSMQQIGQAMHQHGLVGGVAQSFGLQSAPPPPSNNPLSGVGAAQYGVGNNGGAGSSSSGGGSGGGFGTQEERKQFASDVGQSIVQAMQANGMGRNRNG